MKGELVLITPGLSFGELHRGDVSPVEVYQRQIHDWILRPVGELEASGYKAANGMAAFGILLMFFEPHGQYILGIDSNGASKRCFRSGYERFIDSLTPSERGEAPTSASAYKWARCGLFHATKLDSELLVDTIGCGTGIFTRQAAVDACLVNPWRMKFHLEKYVKNYCNHIEQGKDNELRGHFETTFDRLVGETMRHFCA